MNWPKNFGDVLELATEVAPTQLAGLAVRYALVSGIKFAKRNPRLVGVGLVVVTLSANVFRDPANAPTENPFASMRDIGVHLKTTSSSKSGQYVIEDSVDLLSSHMKIDLADIKNYVFPIDYPDASWPLLSEKYETYTTKIIDIELPKSLQRSNPDLKLIQAIYSNDDLSTCRTTQFVLTTGHRGTPKTSMLYSKSKWPT